MGQMKNVKQLDLAAGFMRAEVAASELWSLFRDTINSESFRLIYE